MFVATDLVQPRVASRGETFVTRKTSRAPPRASSSAFRKKIYLGNLTAKRDWDTGATTSTRMVRMLQQEHAGRLASRRASPIRLTEFLDETFGYLELDAKKHVEIDAKYFRPAEWINLLGDAVQSERGAWGRRRSPSRPRAMMVDRDLELARNKSAASRRGPRRREERGPWMRRQDLHRGSQGPRRITAIERTLSRTTAQNIVTRTLKTISDLRRQDFRSSGSSPAEENPTTSSLRGEVAHSRQLARAGELHRRQHSRSSQRRRRRRRNGPSRSSVFSEIAHLSEGSAATHRRSILPERAARAYDEAYAGREIIARHRARGAVTDSSTAFHGIFAHADEPLRPNDKLPKSRDVSVLPALMRKFPTPKNVREPVVTIWHGTRREFLHVTISRRGRCFE